MKLLNMLVLSAVLSVVISCASDGPKMAVWPQKMIQAVNDKYPGERSHLIYVGAPEGFVGSREAVNEVTAGVDSGTVVAIVTSLKIKTSTVIIAGNDDELTSATLKKALMNGKDQVSGSKIVYFGGKESRNKLSDLATKAGVNIEFMDLPS